MNIICDTCGNIIIVPAKYDQVNIFKLMDWYDYHETCCYDPDYCEYRW